ncbi:peptidoglycan amidohydrolase family protein [Pediococcus claussenii]|uniref:peptidoglycan amidohydrolase family protein n=1 Tax=Pediococcus claussenii TaxID=187452 RepID=UPI00081A4358|nr:peptidoglycan amidohydrolase family protein [Pediococcus claussenii]ANZ70386.1 hypothetical protein AYR57_08680 [Pediococcus claussenii]ANZ72202.1 hypothetical protein AYR58_08680 [Pediococcus claussenii]
MAVDNNKVVQWYETRKGKLTYSMNGSRNGTDGTADCSGSVTQAIYSAGGKAYDYLYSTTTLAGYLEANGYKRIAVSSDWSGKKGDVILMSWGYSMADSGGAGGHVGVLSTDKNFISTDYSTGGQYGTAVSEWDSEQYFAKNQPSYWEVWRLSSSVVTKVTSAVKSVPKSPAGIPSGMQVENATYVNGDTQIQIRKNGYGVNAAKAGMLPIGGVVKYDAFGTKDGFVWIHYIGKDKKDYYLPVRPVGKTAWGTFK